MKKNSKNKKIAGILSKLSLILLATTVTTAHAQTITVTEDQYPYSTDSNTGNNGISGLDSDGISNGQNGGNGQNSYEFQTSPESQKENNIIVVGSGLQIKGGNAGNGGNFTNESDEGQSGAGGDGGNGILADNVSLFNAGSVIGGSGGNGGYKNEENVIAKTLKAGNGGNAIEGSGNFISNESLIRGGIGGNIGGNGNGGIGVFGTNNTIVNNNAINGGNGGSGLVSEIAVVDPINGDWSGISIPNGAGIGGDAILGNNLNIQNNGNISGGNGGNNGQDSRMSDVAIAGMGGAGIAGQQITIENFAIIKGGNGGENISLEEGGIAGSGGDAINGRNLQIINNGMIIAGKAGINTSVNGVDGVDGNAIYISGAINTLTNESGSEIIGNVHLANINEDGPQTILTINTKEPTTITGDYITGTNTVTILSGETLNVTGSANFGDKSTLILTDMLKNPSLNANSIQFENTNIVGTANIDTWTQPEYVISETENGISGQFIDKTVNENADENTKDYAGIIIANDGKNLSYGLKWNDETNDSHGTFGIKEYKTVDIDVVLSDNLNVNEDNLNLWDGKSLTKTGYGTLNLSRENTYTGETIIADGVLKTTTENAFANSSGLLIGQNGVLNLGGKSQGLAEDSNIVNAGIILIDDFNGNPLEENVFVKGNMINSGMLVLNNCTACAGKTYVQDGNWTGQSGTVTFGAVLEGDQSITDKLIITGLATGTTFVKVANENGNGAKTLEGIKLIETGGSESSAFVQDGRIVAGLYDYSLQNGTAIGTDKDNWYLTSKLTDGDEIKNALRPEAGSYANNIAAANSLFNTSLRDRQGRISKGNGENEAEASFSNNFWLRYEGSKDRNTSDGQLNTKANRNVFQVGGDLFGGSFTGNDLWQLGIMAGYGYQHSTTTNNYTGHRSKGEVDGYSAGLYGTWYQDADKQTGVYLDTWMLYNWFNNKINGDGISDERYKSRGMTASIEAGYNYQAGQYTTETGVENTFYIRPQAQMIWSGVKADNLTELNGTEVSSLGKGNLQTRLGARLSMKSKYDEENNVIEPYMEANWINNSKNYGVSMNGDEIFIDGAKNIGEMKLGLESQFNDNMSLWGSVGRQFGSKDYRQTTGSVGFKYRF